MANIERDGKKDDWMSDALAFDTVKAPGAIKLAMEGRAPLECGASLAAWPILRMAPKGDGHAVIVFPGLAAGDFSTVVLRGFLGSHGYRTHGWDLGINFGPREGVLRKSLDRVRMLRAESAQRVSLVGWSLGGLYAREVAKLLPEDVRCVITLGTPFTGNLRATHAWRLFQWVSGHKVEDPELMRRLRESPPVPSTSIYSRSDGIVAWPLSLQQAGAMAENIEVQASHLGLGMHPAALYAIADRLAQPEGGWKPFHREGWRQLLFRKPHGSEDSR
jgi:pimeloyl-ACP methyl ester carboxylesterase